MRMVLSARTVAATGCRAPVLRRRARRPARVGRRARRAASGATASGPR
jgi:hypothetical protein